MAKEDGLYLLQNIGASARLEIISERSAGTGANIIGRRRGASDRKVVVCAHYDTKPGTPGALDNASRIAALLLLARDLKSIDTRLSLEFVAFGGEDSWFPGDALYTGEYAPEDVAMAINIDGIGLKDRPTAIAVFNFPKHREAEILNTAEKHGDFVSEQWYAGDHGFFWTMGIPTLAFTTGGGMDLLGTVVHTGHDQPQILDYRRIEQVAYLVHHLITG